MVAAGWHRDLVLYEIPVRAFYDSNGDGIGDLTGVADKIDYVRSLGVGAIWLTPIYPSPLCDDGYDVADFRAVHPDLGTLDDFRRLLARAHAAGLRVLLDLVLNHTSDQHPWFQSARRGPGHPYHDYYVWSPTPDRYQGTKIVFADVEASNWTLEPACGLYYWHRFYAHQPDLNYDNPAVQREMLDVARFWLDLGVDGFRVDAVPYLFEREGTSCESLPETHAYVRALRRLVDTYDPPRVLLAEACQAPADLVPYFGAGNEFHLAFHFPLMARMFLALRREEARPLVEILAATPAIPDGCAWAMFLRNHDELTLELLSAPDRGYMLDQYAPVPAMRLNLGIRRRLWPLLQGRRRQVELLHAVLLGLPGCAVLYYGDEIGMGDDITLEDRMGVRTPMQWTTGTNAGFSTADPAALWAPVITDPAYHFAGRNVDALERTPTSFLHWLRRLLTTRRAAPAFRGRTVRVLPVDNPRVLAFVREHAGDAILCLHNLSRVVAPAAVDLAPWRGRVPVEVIGGAALPRIGDAPAAFTLGPHAVLWCRLESR